MIFESRYDIGQRVMVEEPNFGRIVGKISYMKVCIVGIAWDCLGDNLNQDCARISYRVDGIMHNGEHITYNVSEEEIKVLQ